MIKTTEKNWYALGRILIITPFVIELVKDIIGNKYFEYAAITIFALGSFSLAMGWTYSWRKKTASWIYKGSALLLLTVVQLGVLVYLWFVVAFARYYP